MKFYIFLITILLGLVSFVSPAQTSSTIADLEQQKTKAVAEENYTLASALKQKIQEVKDKEKLEAEKAKAAEELKKKAEEEAILTGKTAVEQNKKDALWRQQSEITELENQKKKAIESENYILANELQGKIKKLNELTLVQQSPIVTEKHKKNEAELVELEKAKKGAVLEQNYVLANQLQTRIKILREEQNAEMSQLAGASHNKTGKKIELEKLEAEKAKAIAETNYHLAGELSNKIKLLKTEIATDANQPQKGTGSDAEIAELEKQKSVAVSEKKYALAVQLNNKIIALKENQNTTVSQLAGSLAQKTETEIAIEKLEKEKSLAIEQKNYKLAGELKIKIANYKKSGGIESGSELAKLEKEKAFAIEQKDYKSAGEIKTKIANLKENQLAEKAQIITPGYNSNKNINTGAKSENNILGNSVRISKSEENETTGIKYRRSSLYTLMVNDPGRPYANVIQDAFFNSAIPEKFNNHNLNSATINTGSYSSDPLTNINTHLQTNQIAKELIAKWFDRNEKGEFDMELIKQRGAYNASNIELNIAKSSARGLALLSDAGEELIGNTYVVVNEFYYINKEEVAKKVNNVNTGMQIGKGLLGMIPGMSSAMTVVNAASTVSSLAAVGATVAGKGYTVKTTSYLFKLVWNAEVAADFYTNYYIDATSYDAAKKLAFDNASSFQLEYIGFEKAWADLQSNIFTNKSEVELITRATTKAVDAGISKLQRKYEAFRTKTPLYSADPLAAKIGLKEGLTAGDKFEVLEQTQNSDGKLEYKRKGTIGVQGSAIWDNTNTIEELNAAGANSNQGNQFTLFNGGGSYAPGMLIRQIN